MRPNVLSRILASSGDDFAGPIHGTFEDTRIPEVRIVKDFVGLTWKAINTSHHVVSADPPWPFKDKLPGASRGAAKNYDLMTIDDLCKMQLPNIADDAILALWRVSSMVEEAYQVARAWGFEPKSEIVWRKKTKNGKRHFGMGRLVRAEHEVAILATRGKYSKLVTAKNIRSTFAAQAPSDETGRAIHSRKPEEFYKLLEKLAKGPYVELFARRHRDGWNCCGKELTGGK